MFYVWEPDAVAWLVVPIVVHAMDVMPRRAFSHIRQEGVKASITILDAAPAIKGEFCVLWVAAAGAHGLPRTVGAAAFVAMLQIDRFPHIASKTSATGGVLTAKIGGANRDFSPAIAATKPVPVPAAVDVSGARNCKSPKTKTDHLLLPRHRPAPIGGNTSGAVITAAVWATRGGSGW